MVVSPTVVDPYHKNDEHRVASDAYIYTQKQLFFPEGNLDGERICRLKTLVDY